jgi:hypothetical protein
MAMDPDEDEFKDICRPGRPGDGGFGLAADHPGAGQQFADATGDHQWIHVDVERATREIGGPIAHGYLTSR